MSRITKSKGGEIMSAVYDEGLVTDNIKLSSFFLMVAPYCNALLLIGLLYYEHMFVSIS